MDRTRNKQNNNSFFQKCFTRGIEFLEEPYYFVKLYFLLLFIQSLFIVAPKMQVRLNQVFIIWGSLIVLYTLFYRRKCLTNKLYYIIGISWTVAFITILLNREAGSVVYSLKTWYLLILVFGIFLPLFTVTKKPYGDVIRGIGLPLIVAQFTVALISFYLFINNISGYIIRPDSSFFWGLRYNFRQSGAINPLLIGLYNEPNYAAVIIFSSIVLSFYILEQRSTGLKLKLFLWLNIIIQSLFLILTNSRSAYLAITLILIVLVILYVKDKILLRSSSWFSRNMKIFIGILLVIILAGGGLRDVSYSLPLSKDITRVTIFLPNSVEEELLPKTEMEPDKTNILILKGPLSDSFVGKAQNYFVSDTEGVRENEGYSEEILKRISSDKEDTVASLEGKGNGRIGRWIETIKLVTKFKPFTGASPRGAAYFANKYSSESESFWRLKAGYSPVNSYLTYLLYYGWPAFILLILAYIKELLVIVKHVFTEKDITALHIIMGILLAFTLIEAVFLSALIEVCTYYSCILAFAFSYNIRAYDSIRTKEDIHCNL